MSDKSFWYTPRDPETRSFRWRTNRDRAAAQEAAERQHPDFTVPEEDMRVVHSMYKGMVIFTCGLGVVFGGAITALVIMVVNR